MKRRLKYVFNTFSLELNRVLTPNHMSMLKSVRIPCLVVENMLQLIIQYTRYISHISLDSHMIVVMG